MIRFLGMLALPAVVFGLFGCSALDKLADIVGNTKVSMKLKNGQKLEGTLLSKDGENSTLQIKYGTVTITSGEVDEVVKGGRAPAATPGSGRLAKWDLCLQVLAARYASSRMLPIPATVIDKGILKNVPYISHRSGDVEFNVYGDPDDPCGLEIGIHHRGPNMIARQDCVRTMLALLNNSSDRETLQSLPLDQTKIDRESLTFEVTPPTAEDAYGAWWISIYHVGTVDQQRASDRELNQITIGRNMVLPLGDTSVLKWKESELKMARPDASGAAPGRVFLRGVHRKNGVYVALSSL